uniref:Deoxyhypusine hydroxylase n=1 Tax=Bubo bubo TaxID=30461 RepID=A0A8C0F199_BUBBB
QGRAGCRSSISIFRAFGDGSALLKHELAYCLGQMQDEAAIPVLIRVLEDTSQEPMVRHEAGEALGAIGNPDVLDILKRYSGDPVVEVAETCQLAVKRLEWLQENKQEPGASPYLSVDPAPPAEETDVAKLRETLLDESHTLFDRYRAMFALRNLGGQAAVLALADGKSQCEAACSLLAVNLAAVPLLACRSHISKCSVLSGISQPSCCPPGPLSPWVGVGEGTVCNVGLGPTSLTWDDLAPRCRGPALPFWKVRGCQPHPVAWE